ncbi:hypothetical protein ACSLIF_26795 [Streptomyces sp. BBFR109]
MTFDPLDTLPAESLNEMVENIEAVAGGSGLDDGAVAASKLGTAAIFLGKAERTTGQSITSATQLITFASGNPYIEVTVPDGGRTLEITAVCCVNNGSGSAASQTINIVDGGSGGASPTTGSTVLGASSVSVANGFRHQHQAVGYVTSPPAGTRRFGIVATGGSGWTTQSTGDTKIMVKVV